MADRELTTDIYVHSLSTQKTFFDLEIPFEILKAMLKVASQFS